MAYRPTVYKTGKEYQKGGKRERRVRTRDFTVADIYFQLSPATPSRK